MTKPEIEHHVWKAIASTINKFREHPAYFFTESDITSYLYMRLYTSKLAVDGEHGRKILCVHREYPTNFRYEKKTIKDVEEVPSLLDPVPGQRGNYDLVVLDTDFAKSKAFDDVVNKNINGLRLRFKPDNSEVLFAIELKYILNSSKEWANQIAMDNAKMKFALQHNVRHAVNLVFCNAKPEYWDDFVSTIHSASPSVCSVIVQSHHETSVKNTPKPVVSKHYTGVGRSYLPW